MSTHCRAKNPNTCRVHGNGKAISAITDQLENNSKNLNGNLRFNLMEMKNRAAKNPQDVKALGVVVEYEDGSQDIFMGTATDPYYATDYNYQSIKTGETIQGIAYNSTNLNDVDYLEEGQDKTSYVQDMLNASLKSHLLLGSEDGTGASASTQKVSKVTVL